MKKVFVKTNNVKRFITMMNNLQRCAEGVPGVGLVYEEPGLGKTYTITWWALQNDAVFVRCANNMSDIHHSKVRESKVWKGKRTKTPFKRYLKGV